ncbi:MAG: hypothetical protein JW800_02660 [Candidatus Omnitrophica bacterium]|nr:hypothetical protein [Candidatus Omnitrophota bacterium]
MKKATRIPTIVVSMIVISATLFLTGPGNSYQQCARSEDGRSGLATISEDRSFYRAVDVICIGQPLRNYKRKSCVD